MSLTLFLLYLPILQEVQSSLVSERLLNFSRPRNCNIHHGCLSLPTTTHKLVGRDTEIQKIIKELSHPDVQVLNLFSGLKSGVGKSSIAIHIGHFYQNEGKVVYYLNVDCLQVDTIIDLFNTGENNEKILLQEWAQSQKNETFIIFDNMDGYYWNKWGFKALKRNFIKILEDNSMKIKILITSKEATYMERYYPIRGLNETNCISLLQANTITTNLSYSHAGAICSLTDGIPLGIKLVAPVLSSDVYSVEHVIARLVTTSLVNWFRKYELDASRITRIAQVMWSREFGKIEPTHPYLSSYTHIDITITAAIDLAFKYISYECYYISILLAKLQSFTTDMAKYFITDEMKRHLSKTPFDVENCIHQLYNRSLLEEHSIFGQLGHKFSTRVRDYLRNTRLNDGRLLKMFWKNKYFQENLRVACGGLDCELVRTIWTWTPRMPQLNNEEITVLTDLIPNLNDELLLHILNTESYIDCDYWEDNNCNKLQWKAIERLNCVFPGVTGDGIVLLINLYENYNTCEATNTRDKYKSYDLLFHCNIWDKYTCRYLYTKNNRIFF